MFSMDRNAVLKWCLNRPYQEKNTEELKSLAGISRNATSYKPLRPSQILKIEGLVSEAMRIMEEEYINPFGVVVSEAFHNLSSGTIIEDELAEGILKVYKVGSDKAQEFKEARIYGRQQSFHAPIKRVQIQSFKSSNKAFVFNHQNQKKTTN